MRSAYRENQRREVRAFVAEELDELRRLVLGDVDTYGDWWRIETALKEALETIRDHIKRTYRRRDKARRRVWRAEISLEHATGPNHEAFLKRDLEDRVAELAAEEEHIAVERAFRDEVRAALLEWQRQDREHRRGLERVSEILRSEGSI